MALSQEPAGGIDSYNHKVNSLDPFSGQLQTLIGTGKPSAADGILDQAGLYQPEGLAILGDRMYPVVSPGASSSFSISYSIHEAE